jgi:16S rRNA (guanine527-N7)-methyltransferase
MASSVARASKRRISDLSASAPSLEKLAGELGLAVAESQWVDLRAFAELLLLWNARINLTGARSTSELYDDHFPDALVLASVAGAGASVIDVGSGGGLPAVPLAILRPDLKLTLVEPRAKRVAFLRTALRAARRDAVVLDCRLEDVARAGPFDLAVSRATFAPGEWLAAARDVGREATVLAAAKWGGPSPGWSLTRDVAYRTGRGHPRWLGVYCST